MPALRFRWRVRTSTPKRTRLVELARTRAGAGDEPDDLAHHVAAREQGDQRDAEHRLARHPALRTERAVRRTEHPHRSCELAPQPVPTLRPRPAARRQCRSHPAVVEVRGDGSDDAVGLDVLDLYAA